MRVDPFRHVRLFALTAGVGLIGCDATQKPRLATIGRDLTPAADVSATTRQAATTAETPPATTPAGLTTFASPEAAADAFAAAAKSDDTAALHAILGPDGRDVIESGDRVADTASRAAFSTAFAERHELSAVSDTSRYVLSVGKDGWPLPIPIVATGGRFAFDATAGRDEIVNRRVGRNELDAIQVLAAIVDAQAEYARQDPDDDRVPAYADRFASRPGRKDGLYWPTTSGASDSPLGPLIEQAADEGYADPATQPTTAPAVSPRTPYHGYYYRMLTRQGPAAEGGAVDYRVNGKLLGGFAVVAWPADYGSGGVMTFVVNHSGVVYQRDLGERTGETVKAITAYDPTPEWTPAEPDGPTTRP